MKRALALVLMLSWPLVAHAVQPDEILKDPVLEARARGLSAGLRCLVCQNQSIDDSNAELARDIRVLVREHLVAGDSDVQIRDYLVQRYGAFILLKPPFEAGTLLLWSTPFLVLILGGAAILVAARRGKRQHDPAVSLSVEEQKRLDQVLAEK